MAASLLSNAIQLVEVTFDDRTGLAREILERLRIAVADIVL